MTTRRRLGLRLLLLGVLCAVGAAWWFSSPGGPPAPPTAALAEVNGPAPAAPVSRAVALAPADGGADAGQRVLEVVSAEDGRPLPNATVTIWNPMRRGHHFRGTADFEANTDARGRVEVPELTTPGLQLSVRLDFFSPYAGPWVADTQIVLEPVPVLHGRVLSATRDPVAGAQVTSVWHDEVSTQSALDGTFSLRLPGVAQVLAEKDGAFARSASAEDLDLRQPLELVLAVPPQDEGRVLGRDGHPLEGVSVTARVRTVSWRQVTAGDGVFRVAKLGVPVLLYFEKPGYVPVYLDAFAQLDLEVTMSRPARLEGVFVDEKGRTLAGATVMVVDPLARYTIDSTVTDDAGHFEFSNLDEPAVLLSSSLEREEETQQTELFVALPEGETTRVTLALRPELTLVSVRFVSLAGVDVPDCQAQATPVPSAGWSSPSMMDGTLALRRGRFRFEVWCDDGRGAEETVEVDPRPEGPPLRIVVSSDAGLVFDDEKPPEPVLVKVVTPTGAPVEGAEVECFTSSGLTGPDGRFRCEVQAADSVWPIHVHVTKGEDRGLARATGKEPEVVVVLRSRVTLRGRIDGALPAGQLRLSVRSAAETSNEPLQGNSFAIEGRAAIRTFVCVEHLDEAVNDWAAMGCAISESGEEVVLRLGDPGTVTFSALDATGAPLPEPVVYLDRVSQGVRPLDGVVTLQVPAGEHVLVLNVDGSRARHEMRFTVRPGQVTALGGLKLE